MHTWLIIDDVDVASLNQKGLATMRAQLAMFDFNWGELILIGIVALVAIGPKELPGALRIVGQWVATGSAHGKRVPEPISRGDAGGRAR